jgi:hypothetical protein
MKQSHALPSDREGQSMCFLCTVDFLIKKPTFIGHFNFFITFNKLLSVDDIILQSEKKTFFFFDDLNVQFCDHRLLRGQFQSFCYFS